MRLWKKGLVAWIVLPLLPLLGCVVEGESQPLKEEGQNAARAFENKDFAAAKASYRRFIDQAKELGEVERMRDGYLGLGRSQACAGETETALKTYDEFLSLRAKSVEPGHLSLFWDRTEIGLVYSALGESAKAEDAFLKAVQALDATTRDEDWIQPAKLLPRYLAAAERGAAAGMSQELRQQRGRYPRIVPAWLGWQVQKLTLCGSDRQVNTIKEFAREVGVEEELLRRLGH